MKSQQFFVLGFSLLVLIVLFQATPAPGQVACGWYNGHPTVDYLGCATDGNGIPVGRNFRIQIPLKAFDPNNCFHTDSKYLHVIATNTTRGGSPTSVWCSECDYFPPGGISGIVTNIFTLYDADFRPRDRVRIDYYWDPLGKCQLGGLCEAGVYETNYPAAIPPQIVQQPQSSALCQGSTAIFFVVAAEGEMIYQWRKNGTNLAGQAASIFTIPSAQFSDAGIYDVLVSNGCGASTSAPASLVVRSSPIITQQPQAQSVCLGGTALFAVHGSNNGPISFQLRHNGNPIASGTNGTLALSFYVLVDSTNQAGVYSFAISNGMCGVISSNALLTVVQPPEILSLTPSATVCPGQTATLQVAASGTPPLFYQWRKDGTNVPNATSTIYQIPSVTPEEAGAYSCAVTNLCGTNISSDINLTVSLPRPSVSIASLTNGVKQLEVAGTARATYVIEAATNLVQPANQIAWARLAANTANAAGLIQFTIPGVTNFRQRFFRALALASPNATCILISTNYLQIDTNSTASFTVQLNGPPTNNLTLTTTRTSGNSRLVVSAGASHVFGAADWNVPHTVTMSQTGVITNNALATFTVSGSGLSNAVVTVRGILTVMPR